MDIAKRIVEANKRLMIGLAGLSLAFALTVSSQGVNATSNDDVVVEDSDIILQIGNSTSSDKAKSIAKVQVIGNYRTVSAAKIKVAQKKNRCKTVSGSQAIQMGVMTQGYNGSGVGYAPENRTTTLCDTDNNGSFDVRAECGNRVKVTHQPQPAEAKATVWVNNFSTAMARIEATVKVKATAKCETDYASASAFARAVAKAKAYVKVKTLTEAKGKVKGSELAKVKTKALAQAAAQAKAKAKAKVKAQANCKSVTIVSPQTPEVPNTPETPETPTPETPEVPEKPATPSKEVVTGKGSVESLPNTGPGAVVATFVGVSSLASVAYTVVTRRIFG